MTTLEPESERVEDVRRRAYKRLTVWIDKELAEALEKRKGTIKLAPFVRNAIRAALRPGKKG
jgi:hypothetical protein